MNPFHLAPFHIKLLDDIKNKPFDIGNPFTDNIDRTMDSEYLEKNGLLIGEKIRLFQDGELKATYYGWRISLKGMFWLFIYKKSIIK